MCSYRSVRSGCVLAVLALAALPAAAKEIHWRGDYRSAWQESRASGRPLLLDFGCDNCVWCRKLDAATLRDPAVAALVNRDFVAYRVNADREPRLAQALHVSSFPTIVIAGPDGTVLERVVGFRNVATFRGHLQHALAARPAGDWHERAYQAATAAIAMPDYPRAIALLKRVVQDGQARPVQQQARALLQEFERQAADCLRQVGELRQNRQEAESAVVLADLVRIFDGTEAARQASQHLAARPR